MVILEYVPLLRVQRDLYQVERGPERFAAYLRTMIDPETEDLRLPLAEMNPMAHEHVPRLIDELLRLDADGAACRATGRTAERYRDTEGSFRVALVVVDDVGGGWTNRYTNDYTHRFAGGPLRSRGWITAPAWTGDAPAAERLGAETAAAIHRTAYVLRHGEAATLADMLAQEAYAMAMAGCREPHCDAEELAYNREVMRPYLLHRDRPTIMACLYGDGPAKSLGYRPLGLSAYAGLALARSSHPAPAARAVRTPAGAA